MSRQRKHKPKPCPDCGELGNFLAYSKGAVKRKRYRCANQSCDRKTWTDSDNEWGGDRQSEDFYEDRSQKESVGRSSPDKPFGDTRIIRPTGSDLSDEESTYMLEKVFDLGDIEKNKEAAQVAKADLFGLVESVRVHTNADGLAALYVRWPKKKKKKTKKET